MHKNDSFRNQLCGFVLSKNRTNIYLKVIISLKTQDSIFLFLNIFYELNVSENGFVITIVFSHRDN